MGNNDVILNAMSSTFCMNKVIEFDGGFFSFAFGDEIALVYNGSYYILNCDSKLWDEVTNECKKTQDSKTLISFWLKKSEEYKISVWSSSFEELRRFI